MASMSTSTSILRKNKEKMVIDKLNLIDSSSGVLWQYSEKTVFTDAEAAESPNFCGHNLMIRLLQAKDDIANQIVGTIWTKFRKAIFDIQASDWLTNPDISTAERSFALWIWGNILGVPRPFVNGTIIPDGLYRRLLLAANYLKFSNGSVADFNRYCSLLFNAGTGSDYPSRKVTITEVVDGKTMTMKYDFNWGLSGDDYAFIDLEGVLPHCVGVEKIVTYVSIDQHLGFDGFFAESEGNIRLFSPDSRIWTLPAEGSDDPRVFGGIPYNKDGYLCLFDSETDNYYYFDDAGDKHWIIDNSSGEQLEPMFDAQDLETRHELTLFPANAPDVAPTYVYYSGRDLYVNTGSVYGRTDEGQMKELHWSYANHWWYYDVDDASHVILGQSKGNFDNSTFIKD